MMNRQQMEDGIRQFLNGLGEEFPGDDQQKTPARVAKAWVEDLVQGYASDPRELVTWTATKPGAGAVLVRNISFQSVCVHHLLPFFGTAQIAYLPGERLAGLSKIARVLDGYARRLQTQEHLTSEVVDALTETLQPRGVVVVLQAEHTCMSLRGVRKEQGRMMTVGMSGLYESDAAARNTVTDLLIRGCGG